jgi:hypothetical protein
MQRFGKGRCLLSCWEAPALCGGRGAPHPDEAPRLLAFPLELQGRKVMEENRHPLTTPALADGNEALPRALKGLVSQESQA